MQTKSEATRAVDCFVAGMPASFATRGERPWKDALAHALAHASPPPNGASVLDLTFSVAPAIGFPLGQDIDNLCEPVLSIIANRLGWFGGRRTGIKRMRARKAISTPTGCRIRVGSALDAPTDVLGVELLVGECDLPLPVSARDVAWATWVESSMTRRVESPALVGVDLQFFGPVNLGDVATGRLKNVIDCLYPVIGGRAGVPADDRIMELDVVRDVSGIHGTVAVRVVALP